jgi:N-acetyl-anhydromuramyl-L-alanine amidase AmpD
MTYRMVPARYDYGVRKAQALAFVVHMTEGDGSMSDVNYLANQPLRGVSVHYVIINTGEIIQMLPESHASGSVNPAELRTTDDAIFTSPDGARVTYGASVRKAVLGTWDRDPNSAVISCEVGGHAVDGPNKAQSEALARLVRDVRTRHPGLPTLGHRDFTSTKGCPGHRVLWASLGGHGKPVVVLPEDAVKRFRVPEGPQQLATLKAGTWLYVYSDRRTDPANVQVSAAKAGETTSRPLPYVGKFSSTPDVRIVAYEGTTPDDNLSSWAMFVRREDIVSIAAPTLPPTPAPEKPSAVAPVTITASQNGKVLNEITVQPA